MIRTVGAPYQLKDDSPFYVELESSQDQNGRQFCGITLYHRNVKKPVGALEMWESLWLKGCWALSYSDIRKGYQRQGLGLLMYQVALDEWGAIHPDWEQRVSEDAAWVWARITAYPTQKNQEVIAIDPGFLAADDPNLVTVDLLNFESFFELTEQALEQEEVTFRTSAPEILQPWLRCAFVTNEWLNEAPINQL